MTQECRCFSTLPSSKFRRFFTFLKNIIISLEVEHKGFIFQDSTSPLKHFVLRTYTFLAAYNFLSTLHKTNSLIKQQHQFSSIVLLISPHYIRSSGAFRDAHPLHLLLVTDTHPAMWPTSGAKTGNRSLSRLYPQ